MISKKSIQTIGALLLTIVVSGCQDGASVQEWVEHVERLRAVALQESERTPYRREQQEALTTYFSELAQMALRLRDDESAQKGFNNELTKADLGTLCGKTLLQRKDWEKIVAHCTKNGFFLCSEEVRAAHDVVISLRSRLHPELQSRFDQAQECSQAI